MIAVTRRRFQSERPVSKVAFINGDASGLPFGDQAFDAVLLSFTLELFPEAEIPLVLEECRRVLSNNGRIGLVTMATNDSLACRLYKWGHARWPTVLDCRPIEAQKWLQAADYRILDAKMKQMWGLPVEFVLGQRN
jgi:demethylmenaquinone methyltransferase/2-methoxy-6-polyprenyl-1,4-benzoquinol methylase